MFYDVSYVRCRTEHPLPGRLCLPSNLLPLPGSGGSPLSSAKHSKGLVVNQRTHRGKFPPLGRCAPPRAATASGIEVHEEKWGTVTVQHVYKMRCECGRSWFELELLRFVKCPACHKLDYVCR